MSKENNIQVPIIETHDLCKYFKTAKGDLHAVDKVMLMHHISKDCLSLMCFLERLCLTTPYMIE